MLYKTTITQTNKDLFSADFDIVGDIINGSFNYTEKTMQEFYGDGELKVRRNEWKQSDVESVTTKGVKWSKAQNKIYRPQKILLNEGQLR